MINSHIENRVNNHYLLGAIKANNDVRYYMAPIAWWILDYPKYDPSILNVKDSEFNFRENLLVVRPSDKEHFLEVMQEDYVDIKDVLLYNSVHDTPIRLLFIIDFDRSEFYSSFYDIDIHEYIPDQWKGYLREELPFF
ncbi:MAG: hypothetical protein MUC87_05125 [Bacteroidia bacterium]|jgi:hypothetical protein|nr:hypothetical protein [Bacteroidia bacterium]